VLTDLSAVMSRELDALRREIELYPDDESLWREVPGCPNSGGTLALHLVGNLRHFIGARIGRTGYVRNRDAEFATRGMPRQAIVAMIDEARRDVVSTLAALDPSALSGETPLPQGDRSLRTSRWLIHLAVHLGYHLGQVDYHRRAVTGDRTSAATLSLPALLDA
jgi:hypothetical protein